MEEEVSSEVLFLPKTPKKSLRKRKEGKGREKPSPLITNYSLQFCGRGQTAESGRTAIESSSVQKGKSRKSDNCSRRRRRKNRGFRGREEEAATYDFCFPAFFLPFFLFQIFSFISAKAPSSSSSSLLFALVRSGNGEEKGKEKKSICTIWQKAVSKLANASLPHSLSLLSPDISTI